MSLEITASPEHIATLIQQGIRENFERLIKAELLKQIDPVVSQVARDLASKTASRVVSYNVPVSASNPFGPETKISLIFNNKDVEYTP